MRLSSLFCSVIESGVHACVHMVCDVNRVESVQVLCVHVYQSVFRHSYLPVVLSGLGILSLLYFQALAYSPCCIFGPWHISGRWLDDAIGGTWWLVVDLRLADNNEVLISSIASVIGARSVWLGRVLMFLVHLFTKMLEANLALANSVNIKEIWGKSKKSTKTLEANLALANSVNVKEI